MRGRRLTSTAGTGTRAVALLGAMLLALAAPGNASPYACDDNYPIDVGGSAYVAFDGLATDELLYSIWAYAETNGVVSLQRGGTSLVGDLADPCQTTTSPDLLVFGGEA